jgi:glutathione peroxidase
MSDQHGRVFSRSQQYTTLPADLQEDAVAASAFLTEKKSEVFQVHHAGITRVPQSVRGKPLLDVLEKWLKEKEEPLAEAEEETKPAEVPAEDAATPAEEPAAPAEEPAAPAEEPAKPAEEPAKPAEEPPAPAEAPADKVEDATAEAAPAAAAEEEPKAEEVKETPAEVEKPPVSAEPSKYRVRGKEIVVALILSGFLTTYKDREKNFEAPPPTEYTYDSELLVPLSADVVEAKTTTVWSVKDGATYANVLKRKAGVLASFTQGKDVYVLLNKDTKKIYLFESDVARAALAEFDASDGLVQYDHAHYEHGVKWVHGDKTELFNLQTKPLQEAFVNELLNIGAQYREVHALEIEKIKSIYELSDIDIEGNEVSFGKYKGKVLLIVNVSSKCGLTPINYPQLTELYGKYREQGLEILAFPCNQFAGQEPGTHEEILEFVKQYNAEYAFFEKHDVNGAHARPVFTYLKAKLPGAFGNYIKWNFTKFLVDRDGQPYKRFAPTDKPLTFEDDIKELLAKAPTPEVVETEEAEKAEETVEAEVKPNGKAEPDEAQVTLAKEEVTTEEPAAAPPAVAP